MKKSVCRALLMLSVLLGALRFADLLFFTEPSTGFVALGSVWIRYTVLFCFAAALIFAPAADKKAPVRIVALPAQAVCAAAAVPAFVAGALAQWYAIREFQSPTTALGKAAQQASQTQAADMMTLSFFALRMILGISLWVFGVWLVMLYLRKTPLKPELSALRTIGFWGSAGFYALVILRYAENPASVHRILHILPIFSALAALLFITKLIGLLCVECTPAYARSTAAAGVFAFLMCTCIELPQGIWQMLQGQISLLNIALALLLSLIGICGAALAAKLSS